MSVIITIRLFVITERDVAKDREVYVLKRPRRLGPPQLERYPTEALWMFGVFCKRPRTKQEEKRLCVEIDNSISDSMTVDGRIDVSKVAASVLKPYDVEAEEAHRFDAEVSLFRRHRGLADAVKQRDAYICQICKFDFAKVYPGITARYAEAHHILPLSKSQSARRTRLSDLITVCSNCHGMLHVKISGGRAGIRQLRAAVQRSGYKRLLRRIGG